MSSSTPLIWYQLYDSDTGQVYKGTSASSVAIPREYVIAQFRDAVKAQNSSILTEFVSSQLLVYKNKDSFDKRDAFDEEEPLEEDSLIDGFGNTEKDSLIVVVPSFDSTREYKRIKFDQGSNTSSDIIGIDGINIETEHLERTELLQSLKFLVKTQRFVLLSSPPASGKSSLFMILKHNMLKEATVIGISCFKDESLVDLLKRKGLDLSAQTVREDLRNKRVIYFLDDAQAKYQDKAFWPILIKSTGLWLPFNISFIISATHSLALGIETPEVFASISKLSRDDFILSDEETYQLLEFEQTGLRKDMVKYQTLKDVLVRLCGGLVGSLRLSIMHLTCQFMKDPNPPESALLQYCFSLDFFECQARCFGSSHSEPIGDDFKNFLKRVFIGEHLYLRKTDKSEDAKTFSRLQKAGILVKLPGGRFGFSSPLAKIYCFKLVFPNRSLYPPSSLFKLVEQVISSMSASALKNSTIPKDTPNEALFQRLFMEGLAKFTTSFCLICPELSKIFPSDSSPKVSEAIPGEIDFYIHSDLRWGIELLINGSKVTERINRFNGKYFNLGMADHAVVDFRVNDLGEPTQISKHSKRITAFFKKGDYSNAKCIFGNQDTVIEISLAN